MSKTFDVSAMEIFELRELSAVVNKRITEIAGHSSIPAPSTMRPKAAFKHGDLIEFTTRDGRTIRASVNRLNDKTIGCKDTVTKGKWRVSYSLARLVGADKPVPPLIDLKPYGEAEIMAAQSIGAASTAPDAGTW